MKKILNWVFAKLDKIGKDKYQHFTLGAFITAFVFIILTVVGREDVAWWLSLFATFGIEFIKEFVIDSEGSPADFAATMLGGLSVGTPLFILIFL